MKLHYGTIGAIKFLEVVTKDPQSKKLGYCVCYNNMPESIGGIVRFAITVTKILGFKHVSFIIFHSRDEMMMLPFRIPITLSRKVLFLQV